MSVAFRHQNNRHYLSALRTYLQKAPFLWPRDPSLSRFLNKWLKQTSVIFHTSVFLYFLKSSFRVYCLRIPPLAAFLSFSRIKGMKREIMWWSLRVKITPKIRYELYSFLLPPITVSVYECRHNPTSCRTPSFIEYSVFAAYLLPVTL